jgi:branched-chain amino acid transport system substrate-binding protein
MRQMQGAKASDHARISCSRFHRRRMGARTPTRLHGRSWIGVNLRDLFGADWFLRDTNVITWNAVPYRVIMGLDRIASRGRPPPAPSPVFDERHSMLRSDLKTLSRALWLTTCCLAAGGLGQNAVAQTPQAAPAGSSPPADAPAPSTGPVRITVITDLADDIYNARSGAGGVDATRMAVADFGGRVLGRPIVVDTRNDHNKPSEAPALAEDAYSKGADILMDVQNSPIAIAVSKVAAAHHRLAITTEAATPALTRGDCTKYAYNYSFDLLAVADATAKNITALPDGKRWVAIVADTGFGHSSVAAFTPQITANGGALVQSFVVKPGDDLAHVLQQIQALKPDAIGIFSAGADADDDVAAVTKLGLKAHIAIPLLHIADIDRLKGSYAGVRSTVPWYWDMDAAAHAWSDRFAKAHHGLRPTEGQAADYSATMQWLRAVKAVGTTDSDAVIKYLDGRTFDDMFAQHGTWRAADHAVIHDLYVVQVLPPGRVKQPHAWYRVVQVIPAAEAFPPASAAACKM